MVFLRYCYSKVGWYFHWPIGWHGAKGLNFQWKIKVSCGFDRIYCRNPWWKTSFFVQCSFQLFLNRKIWFKLLRTDFSQIRSSKYSFGQVTWIYTKLKISFLIIIIWRSHYTYINVVLTGNIKLVKYCKSSWKSFENVWKA